MYATEIILALGGKVNSSTFGHPPSFKILSFYNSAWPRDAYLVSSYLTSPISWGNQPKYDIS